MQVVITGTSRGIGLALAGLALQEGNQVLGVARQPDRSSALQELLRQHADRLRVIDADVREARAVDIIAAAVNGAAVDLLINNAGILREGTTREDFVESFTVNTVAPYELTHALLPALRAAKQPRVVHITSSMGSLAENTTGGYYAYRSSKAALNMINRSIARDNPWLTAVVVHPGWVQTRMGGSGAPVAVAESARGIWKLATQLPRNSTGRFFDYLGQELPW